MLKLTKKMEISLIIFKHLKSRTEQKNFSEIVTARDISNKYRISENFVAKIMQKLCKEKILASKQGVQGGYYLNADLNQLTFLDLIEKIENNFEIVHCISEKNDCSYQTDCTIISPMKALNQKFKDFYQSVQLNELLGIPLFHQKSQRSLKQVKKLKSI